MKNDQHEMLRHSMAHVMAAAVQKLYPETQFAIGPAIDSGFYYDMDLSHRFSHEELGEIEAAMKELIRAALPFEKSVVSKEDALKKFAAQPYKVELINDLPEDEEISVYKVGTFEDLCRGPHVENSGKLNAEGFKLLSIAGAYWRGDESRPMLQRIYGTAFPNPKELRLHLKYLEEVEKRDHRLIGRELDLFSLHEEAGPGLVYWHPNGASIRNEIEKFWKEEHYKNGYETIYTPHMGQSWLWETSGHLDFYKESMYQPIEMDKNEYYIKPMNCPFHIMIYRNKKHSYRDLPIRWAEMGTVYRYERSGTLHGLMRVRGFTQDDAHIFCSPGQIEDEVKEVLRFSLFMLRSFGFEEINAYLATKPEKSAGDDERWQVAIASLERALKEAGLPYTVDEGGGAFYGPKIDLKVKDAIGRVWQLSTIQFDFNLPERFNLLFTDSDGVEKRPYMVHRALLGSLERFFGILIEHYSGAFPVWLSPIQVEVIPVGENFNEYAASVASLLREGGIRAHCNLENERMNAKIRKAQLKKIPYMAIVGEKEREAGQVSLRLRSGGDQKTLSTTEALNFIKGKSLSKELI